MQQGLRTIPAWAWGALIAVVLILLSTRGRLSPNNEALRQIFAAQPTTNGATSDQQLPMLELSAMPAELQQVARDLLANLGAGNSGRPVETAVESSRLRVEVRELRPGAAGITVVGEVTNIGRETVQVPISAFELRDSAGVSYSAGDGASATLKPGESTPLELDVPLPEGRGLLLVTNLPPDPPLEQRLIVVE